MTKTHEGWISVYRKITVNPIWTSNQKYDKRSAFIEMLLMAQHKSTKILVDNTIINLKRGQFLNSEVKLSERWKWSRKAVRNFLMLLEKEYMVKKIVKPNKFIIIEIINYDKYQCLSKEDTTEEVDNAEVNKVIDTAKEQQRNSKGTTEVQAENTYNNINNGKKVNNDKKEKGGSGCSSCGRDNRKETKVNYAEYVWMTNNEYQSLIDKFGDMLVKNMIEILDNYKGSSGKIYKSDYRAILSWVVNVAIKNKNNRKNDEEAQTYGNINHNKNSGPSSETIRLEQAAREQGCIGEQGIRDIECEF